MLQIKNISKQYKTGDLIQHALNDVSLNFRDCEFVSILGPSGSGKTTLLNIVGGLDRYDSGDLIINNVSTKDYKDRDWDSYRNHTVGFVFQSYNLIPHQTILENVDKVMKSDFKGMLHIRVNVDARNEVEFAYVYKMMQKRYPKDFGRRINVYPGFVKGDDHPDVSCFFEADEQGAFAARMYTKYGIVPLNLFPQKARIGCTLTRRNAFVVGPDGELYKCWDDVGIPDAVVGSIDRFDNWNMALIAEGMVASSYLDSQECKECFYFPICNGGCHRIRMKNLRNPDCQHSPCSYFRGNLEKLLELHYERKKAIAAHQAEMKLQQAVEKNNG